MVIEPSDGETCWSVVSKSSEISLQHFYKSKNIYVYPHIYINIVSLEKDEGTVVLIMVVH